MLPLVVVVVVMFGAEMMHQVTSEQLKVAAVVEQCKFRDEMLDLQEYVCQRLGTTVSFEIHRISSDNPVFLDGLVHHVVKEDTDLILWFVSCDLLDFLPNKVTSEATMLFLTEDPCLASVHTGPPLTTGFSGKVQALTDTMDHLKWSHVMLFYDDSLTGTDLLLLTSELSTRYIKSAIYRIDTSSPFTENIRNKFISLNRKRFDENHYLLVLRKDTLEAIIRQAAPLWMLVNRNFWIVISEGFDVESLTECGLNPRNANMIVIEDVCDICRNDMKPIQDVINGVQFLPSPQPDAIVKDQVLTIVCLIVKMSDQSVSTQSPLNCSSHSSILTNITSFAVSRNDSRLNQSCYSAYEMRTVKEGPQQMSTVARWRPDSKLSTLTDFYPNAKYRLGNITLNVSTLTLLPYSQEIKVDNHTDYTGFCIDILKELSRQLNFSYTWVIPADHQFGAEVNGSFTGLVGLLERGETDIVAGPLTLTYGRSRVIDYSYPYGEEGRGMLIKKPGNSEAGDLFKVFHVFDQVSWICCLSVIFVISAILTLIDGLHKISDSYKNSRKGSPDSGKFRAISLFSELNWKEILWSIFTIYVSQNGAWEPKSVRSRILVLSWWVFTIIITTYFTANLTAFFTVSVQLPGIESLKDLAEQKEILPFTLAGSAIYTEFKKRKDPIGKEIYRQMQHAPKVMNAMHSLDYIRTGKYVFISLWSEVKLYAARYCKEFTVAGKPFTIKTTGFGFQKGSALNVEVSHFLNIMREAGLIERWRKNSWTSSYSCASSENMIYKAAPVSIQSLGGVYIVFGVIALISTFCFCLESFFTKGNKFKRIPFKKQ